MNKTEKLICLVLGALLAGYIFMETGKKKEAAQSASAEIASNSVNRVVKTADAKDSGNPGIQDAAGKNTNDSAGTGSNDSAGKDSKDAIGKDANDSKDAKGPEVVKPSVPEKLVTLENDELKLELSTWGAVVKKATLKKYAKDCGEVSADNPALELDFSSSPIGAGARIDPYSVFLQETNSVTFKFGTAVRKITLGENYQVTFDDEGLGGDLSLGVIGMGSSKNDILSIDSWQQDDKGGRVIHHCEGDSPFKAYLVGGLGGCGGSKDAGGFPTQVTVPYSAPQKWIAVKNRFFVTALVSSTSPNAGFSATIERDLSSSAYRPASVAATVKFADDAAKRTTVFYVGPKKQSLLWGLGMKDVMEFGMWRWLCYPLVWVLNLFNDWIPNYGVAIILLTILVRLVFWPLTRKSTEGMKKMQELQPKMKEIQKKFKDNPQRLQQETWQLYRSEKVNPASSCLPMLIQIPVFIALFNVLRSAVELRYAPFLWIADLSEPEGLFASWFPFGGLNVLPVLMAVSTGLQSAFTPSSGDKNQQRMMMIFMPAMMLFMFYSFPSALSLYWFLSNLFSIVQMWFIRRQTAKKQEVLMPEVIDPPQTRQMKRHA